MIAGRLPLWPVPEGPWHYCDEHAALVGLSGECLGLAFDLALAQRSVTIQAAYAFRDWPPPGIEVYEYDGHLHYEGSPADLAAIARLDPLWARYLDGDR